MTLCSTSVYSSYQSGVHIIVRWKRWTSVTDKQYISVLKACLPSKHSIKTDLNIRNIWITCMCMRVCQCRILCIQFIFTIQFIYYFLFDIGFRLNYISKYFFLMGGDLSTMRFKLRNYYTNTSVASIKI